jgi:hypothetical protein
MPVAANCVPGRPIPGSLLAGVKIDQEDEALELYRRLGFTRTRHSQVPAVGMAVDEIKVPVGREAEAMATLRAQPEFEDVFDYLFPERETCL